MEKGSFGRGILFRGSCLLAHLEGMGIVVKETCSFAAARSNGSEA